MPSKISKFVYWTPRIISILYICFLAIFSFDVIEPGVSIGQIIIGMLIHNIPSFVLTAVLAVSWKREIVGGIVFTVVGSLFLARAVAAVVMNGFGEIVAALAGSLLLAAPALFVGILFFINWRKRKAVTASPSVAPQR